MNELNVVFKEEIFNPIFFPLLFDESDFLVLKGGGSSGKSHFIAQKILYRILKEEGHRVIINRKVGKTIRNSQYKLLCDLISIYRLGNLFDIRDSDMTITCPHSGSEILAIGMDDKEKIKSLTKPTMGWLEEPTELTYQEFLQFTIRFRGLYKYYVQIMMSLNPIDIGHWIHDEMFPMQIDEMLKKRSYATMVRKLKVEHKGREREHKVRYMLNHSTYKDNNFLDLREKAILEDLKNKDLNYYNVYCLGEWGSVGHLVFKPPPPILDEFPEDFNEVIYGLDFGYHHASALVKIGIRDEDGLGLCFYEEEILYVKKMTNLKLIEHIQEHNLIDNKDAIIYADSAEPNRIEEFEEAGFNIRPAIKGQNSVRDGIGYMKSKHRFTHSNSVNLNREYRQYHYKMDKDGNPIDEPSPFNDDCISACRYAEYSWSKMSNIHIAFIDLKAS